MKRQFLAWLLAGTLALAGCGGRVSASSSSSESGTTSQTSEVTSAEATTANTSSARESNATQSDYTKARVSYLGPEGTYTQEACGVFFGHQGTYEPQADVAASVQALVDGQVDYAVIPQENTIGGPVSEYLDEVISRPEVSVVGEVELPISQNLLVKPGTKLEDIQTVYSHKQGIAQGKAWLQEHVPNAEVQEVSSTAEGARMASEAADATAAAIGSSAAADVYGLEVVADNIQQNDANKTRFYVLSLDAPASAASDRLAFVASGSARNLPKLLASAEAQGLTVVAVHERPRKTELGEYTYVVECAGGGADQFERIKADNLDFELRYLGSFPVRA